MTDPQTKPTAPPVAKSTGRRFFIMLAVVLLMAIPLLFVSLLVMDRSGTQATVEGEIVAASGGVLQINQIAIQVPGTRTRATPVKSRGNIETVRDIRSEEGVVTLRAESLKIDITTETETRRRGVFEVPVYKARVHITGQFDPERLAALLGPNDTIDRTTAQLMIGLPRERQFLRAPKGSFAGQDLVFHPNPLRGNGISAPISLTEGKLDLTLELRGARSILVKPDGRDTEMRLTSDWPDPSFRAPYLPESRTVRDDGFEAQWTVPYLNRNQPMVSWDFRSGDGPAITTHLFTELDIYHRTSRALKYGLVLIAMTFTLTFMTERFSGARVHPVQFLLIGGAQAIFFVLLLAFAERIGFALAYAGAAVATIALLSYYVASALRLGPRTPVYTGIVALFYGLMYLLLTSTDYTLLIGAIAAFAAMAGLMAATRNTDWGS